MGEVKARVLEVSRPGSKSHGTIYGLRLPARSPAFPIPGFLVICKISHHVGVSEIKTKGRV